MALESIDQRNVNLAAITFTTQYYRFEAPLIREFENPTNEHPRWVTLAKWAAHFAVARTLRGIGGSKNNQAAQDESGENRRKAYTRIVSILEKQMRSGMQVDKVKRVSIVEGELKAQLAIKTNLKSAASKFLWLVDHDVVIYDSNVRSSLDAVDQDYEAFCECWQSQFAIMREALLLSIAELRKISHMFPSDWDIGRDTHEEWFLQRTFDQYHWAQRH